jgi:hypothetical protein
MTGCDSTAELEKSIDLQPNGFWQTTIPLAHRYIRCMWLSRAEIS